MRFKGLDLNLLVALDALLTHQNVTRAAEQIAISQSAMSGALARLREHFQDELLVQVHRRMTLTPLAQSLELPLRAILAQTTKLLNARSEFDPPSSDRRFTISCSDYVWAVLIVHVLRQAATQAPGVEICYAGTSSRFERNEIDLLIAPTGYGPEDHPSEVLFRERYACVVWTGNTLVQDTLSEQQYFTLGHVVAYFERRTFVDEWFHNRYGDVLKVAAIAPSFTLVPPSVIGTNHVAVVPMRLARYYAEHMPLRVLPPPIDIPEMIDVIQWKSYQAEDLGVLWLRDLIKQTAKTIFQEGD